MSEEPIFPLKMCKSYVENVSTTPSSLNNIYEDPPSSLKVTKEASIYISAVLMYISSEILELAGNRAYHAAEKRISPKDIQTAILDDRELTQLLQSVQSKIKDTSELPSIHYEPEYHYREEKPW